MSIKCGNCKGYHDSVLEVRMCHSGGRVVTRGEADVNTPAAVNTNVQPIEITEGMWKLDDRIIKIQKAVHGNGRLYGKELLVSKDKICSTCGCWPDDHFHAGDDKSCMYCDCKELVEAEKIDHSWEKIVGAVRLLKNEGGRKMTLEEAEEFGALYGFCCVCGRTLTDETSIANGIGPKCAQRFSA